MSIDQLIAKLGQILCLLKVNAKTLFWPDSRYEREATCIKKRRETIPHRFYKTHIL